MGLKDRRNGTGAGDAVDGLADETMVTRLRALVLEEVDLGELSDLSETQRRARLERVVGHLVTREGPMMTTLERSLMIRRVVDEALGLGVLEPLLGDESITEIMVNGHHDVWVERDGRLERIDTRFVSEAQIYQTIDRIVSQVNRRVDESSPMVDARLPTGERVNVIIPPLSLTGPVITIRRFPRAYTMDQLVEMGSLSTPVRDLLEAIVVGRLNVIISGGTGTGKTTFLNAMSGFLPDDERLITIEDSAELQLQQPHVISLESRPANVEGKGQITIRDLVRNSLRMRPDRIIVGEVRGGETLDMLQAMNTGHEGSLATVHANSADDAVTRLETLASMSELDIKFEALRDQINGAVDVVVHLSRYIDGSRGVGEVAVVTSRHGEPFALQPVARFDAEVVGSEREVQGEFAYHALPPVIERRLTVAGATVPPVFRSGVEVPVRATVDGG
jgi:pilus assembly protein CpaF